jgi:hypothetical protein
MATIEALLTADEELALPQWIGGWRIAMRQFFE